MNTLNSDSPQQLSTTRTKHSSGSSVGNSIAAGYIAGVTGTLIGHPLDSVKVWLQTGNGSLPPTGHHSPPPQQQPLPLQQAPLASNIPTQHHHHSIIKRLQSTQSLTPTTTGCYQKILLSTHRSMSTTVPVVMSQRQQLWPLLSQKIPTFYAGVTGPLVTVGMVQSLNFAVYDAMRRTLYTTTTSNNNDYLHNDSLGNVATASMTAGAVSACITNPLLLIKTVQQTTTTTEHRRLSFRQALHHVLAGRPQQQHVTATTTLTMRHFRHLYTGFVPHCVCEVGGRGLYFVLYESFKRRQRSSNNNKNTVPDRMLAAGSAGLLCSTCIYPFDMMRCRMFASGTPRSILATMTTLPWQALYRGYSITLIKAGPVAAIVLPVYDIALDELNKNST